MTSKEFAKLIGVSQATVSRALNDSDVVPLERREFIKKKAEEYGFILNSQARSLKTNRTGTVGILFPRHFASMHANLGLAYTYDLVQKELSKHGYDVMVVYEREHSSGLTTFERIVKTRKVDGFIVLRLEFSQQELDLIRRYKVPCVYILNAAMIDEYSSSYISDSEYGGYLMGAYLGKFKDSTHYYINVNATAGDAENRLAGFRRGLREHGVELRPDCLFECSLSVRAAYECIMENKERFMHGKSVVVAYNDATALGALNAFQQLGLAVPDQVQIAGQGALPLAAELSPTITTIQPFREQIARMSCEYLKRAIDDADTEVVRMVIKPELVKGETTL